MMLHERVTFVTGNEHIVDRSWTKRESGPINSVWYVIDLY